MAAARKKIWIIVALCLIGAGVALSAAGYFLSGKDLMALNSRETIRSVCDIEESFSRVSVGAPSANVSILPSDDGKCRVETSSFGETECRSVASGGTLKVIMADWHGGAILFGSPKVTVYLPQKQYESLEVRTESGDIAVGEGVLAVSATLKSSSGRISCGAEVTGALEAKSASGGVSVSGVGEAEVRLESSSGSVTLSDSRPASALLESTSGRILLREVTVSGELSASNTSGSVRLDNCDAANKYIRSTSGSVSGTLLSGKNFTADSSSGSVRVPESSGEGVCEVRTSSGSIRLEVRE